jgi:hypothetical protein
VERRSSSSVMHHHGKSKHDFVGHSMWLSVLDKSSPTRKYRADCVRFYKDRRSLDVQVASSDTSLQALDRQHLMQAIPHAAHHQLQATCKLPAHRRFPFETWRFIVIRCLRAAGPRMIPTPHRGIQTDQRPLKFDTRIKPRP